MDALKLAALDAEDLQVIAAHLQDAVLTVGDIEWRPREKRFVLVVNRLAWEAADGDSGNFERRRTLVHFARVEAVRSTRIRRGVPDAVLSLLTIRFETGDAPAGRILLDFSGGGAICLDVECIEACMADLGAAWTTEHRPVHLVV